MSLVLFADDEEHLRLPAAQTFELNDLEANIFTKARELLSQVHHDLDAVVVTDIRMPEMDGVELLQAILQIDPDFPVIMVTGHGDVAMAVDCMKLGAYDFIEKPYSQSQLVKTVIKAQEKRALTLEVRQLRQSLDATHDVRSKLIGSSKPIQKLRQNLKQLASLETDVLICGETGVGKSIAARLLHDFSARKDGPFVHINCAAIPDNLVEIELFGHEAGAFPSAMRSRYGKFEHARGGTVFLDSIESLSLETQAKILQSVDRRVITRLGSNDPVELDVRFVAASQSDLKELVAQNHFRKDLYYHLSGAELEIPPLRARKEDIPVLFSDFVGRSAVRHKRDVPNIPHSIYASLISREWPGNLHELQKLADRFVLGIALDIDDNLHALDDDKSLTDILADHERTLIMSALDTHQGRLKETYEALKISRKSLYEKMQKFGLKKDDFVSD